jgi:hypothetical protein
MKFQKVKNIHYDPPIKYDWMMVIESLDELTDFHQKSMAAKICGVWANIFDVQQGKAHFDNKLSFLIDLEACTEESKGRQHSLIDLTATVLGKIWEAKAKAILDCGKIYINKNGGFFAHSEDIVVLEEFISDNYLFPEYTEKDIKVKQWTDGTHWYAYVGDIQVEIDGENKWDTEERAKSRAGSFLYRMKNQQYILKT